MPEVDAMLIANLVAARAAIDAVLMRVTEEQQAAAQKAPEKPQETVLEEPVAPGTPESCGHQNRKELAVTFGATEHWICQDCGHEHIA